MGELSSLSPLMDDVPAEEIEWLEANSREQILSNGDYFAQQNGPADAFYIVLEGEMHITRDMNGTLVVLGTTPRGIIGGEISLLQNKPSLMNARALMTTRLRVFDLYQFRAMFGAAPVFAGKVLEIATDRMANTSNLLQQNEKMAALGKLSAGLSHELNNPAAAARRAAQSLYETLPDLQASTMRLNTLGLNETQIRSLAALQADVIDQQEATELSPLQRSDREDELGEWLETQGVENAWEIAPTFVGAGVTTDDLQKLTAHVGDDHWPQVLAWLSSALLAAGLLREIQESTGRISELVKSVKEYTYMDQAPVQEVDVHRGIEATVRVLQHKLKYLTLERELDENLPKILARGGELNQVWTNLLDNAADAVKGQANPKVWIKTRCENNFVMVEIMDNGPGIPEEHVDRVFEPFFTTKGVGVGTGLGLDIVFRIVGQHGGTIEVRSEPGCTRFIVRLPTDDSPLKHVLADSENSEDASD